MITKVYAVLRNERSVTSIDDENFIREAESNGNVWTLSGFETEINLGKIDLNKLWVRFISVSESNYSKCEVCGYKHSFVEV